MLHGAAPGADSRRSRCRAATITGACPRKYSHISADMHCSPEVAKSVCFPVGATFAGFAVRLAVHSHPQAGISARTSICRSGAAVIIFRLHYPDFSASEKLD